MQPMLLYPRRSRFAPTKTDKKSKQLWSVCQGFFPNIVRPYYIKGEFSGFLLDRQTFMNIK